MRATPLAVSPRPGDGVVPRSWRYVLDSPAQRLLCVNSLQVTLKRWRDLAEV